MIRELAEATSVFPESDQRTKEALVKEFLSVYSDTIKEMMRKGEPMTWKYLGRYHIKFGKKVAVEAKREVLSEYGATAYTHLPKDEQTPAKIRVALMVADAILTKNLKKKHDRLNRISKTEETASSAATTLRGLNIFRKKV